MLSSDEKRAWDEIRRHYAREAEEPARRLDLTVQRPRSSTPVALRAAVVAGGGLAVLLVVLGAPVAGLAIAVATVPQWLLWRYWPLLEGEHARVVARLLAIRDGSSLLDSVPALRDRLSHRNHWVDPLSHLQVALLARARAGDATVGGALMATITGIAAGLRNTG